MSDDLKERLGMNVQGDANNTVHWYDWFDLLDKFEKWLMKYTRTKSVETAIDSLVWAGNDMPKIVHYLQESAFLHRESVTGMVRSVFSTSPPKTLCLQSVIHQYENSLAYAGWDHVVGVTLKEIATSWKLKLPKTADAARRAEVVSNAFHTVTKLQKRTYEQALSLSGRKV